MSMITFLLTPQILYAKDVDQRSTTFEKAILMGKEYQRRTKVIHLMLQDTVERVFFGSMQFSEFC